MCGDIMKKFLLVIVLFFMIPIIVSARRGCCSHHGGVAGCASNGRQLCNDGTLSPTCMCESSSNYSNNSYNQVAQISGCTDPNAINYNPSANVNDGSCIIRKYGCTNKYALNYDASANTDDGSCIEKKYGCMNKEAVNYDEAANISNGNCRFKEIEIKNEKIKYKTKYRKNKKKYRKYRKVKRKGINGEKEVTYVVIKNERGSILSREKESEKIIKKAQNKIIEVGTKKHFYEF